jgi:hypothetical protein
LADVTISGATLTARGLAIGTDPCPYRLEYELTTREEFVTKRLIVRTTGWGWRRGLILERSDGCAWSCTTASEGSLDRPMPGGDLTRLSGARDCDLGLSPLTNTMPVLRHRLHELGGSVALLMAWVAVPELAVVPSPQRYSFLRRMAGACFIRYESLDSGFTAEITFDEHGLVLDYPGIARVVASRGTRR